MQPVLRRVQFHRTDTGTTISSGFACWTNDEIAAIMSIHMQVGRTVWIENESVFSVEWPEFTDALDFFDAYTEIDG
jgi:hypothetical protein